MQLFRLLAEWLPIWLAVTISIVAAILGGCSSVVPSQDGSSGQTFSLSGSGSWAWNRTPQGGSDEKSSRTPVEPPE